MKTLMGLINRSDEDTVRLWLADRGLVAVERKLMEEIAAMDNGNPFKVCYIPEYDRYEKII